jgi:hypothetical protein
VPSALPSISPTGAITAPSGYTRLTTGPATKGK